jgi:aspartate-semialdehyde dehydrogenase
LVTKLNGINMTDKKINVAVLGATGLVGETMLSILHERKFPVAKLFPLASSNSAGETVLFGNKPLLVEDAESFDFSQVQIALFSAGSAASAKYAPRAAAAGCVVIDNTSHFRNEADVPLVITEINPEKIADYKKRHIIANPNCSTIQMLVALFPIYKEVGITEINVATYQSVSGTGRAAVSELVDQTTMLLNGRPAEAEVYPQQIAFNALPHIDAFQDNGYTKEEMKMLWETRKILNDQTIRVNATTVRVPVIYGHSEVVNLTTKRPLTATAAVELLSVAPGVVVHKDPKQYHTVINDAVGNDAVFVSRVRNGIDNDQQLTMWVVCDNIRKGAALNAVQIAELLLAHL